MTQVPVFLLNSTTLSESEIEKHLSNYLCSTVPALLKQVETNSIKRYVLNEDDFKEVILKPFEFYLCGGTGHQLLEDLKVYNKPAKFCGKLFNVGDPTYTCKDCAADPTCVFCHDCFHLSAHKEHKYKLHASMGGGGTCDCGDKEAWSQDPACKKHQEGLDVDESRNPLDGFPEDLTKRATLLFTFLLKYCVDMLCWSENNDLPQPLSIQSSHKNSHIVMLFNDESHSYEEVINALTRAVKVKKKQAFQFAAMVDREGMSAIFNGTLTQCADVAWVCKNSTSGDGKKSLRCEPMHRDVVTHQLAAIEIMKWLNILVNSSDCFRRLHSILVTKVLQGRTESLLKQIIYKDIELWIDARNQTHQLFMNSLLMDMFGRVEFAVTFSQCYEKLMDDFIKDDHDHSVSVASLSVQVFTVPTIMELLILKHNILETCFQVFINAVSSAIGENGYLDFQTNDYTAIMKRVNYILNDMKYMLRHKPKWTDEFKTKFLNGFKVFLKILEIMQGMDSVTRKTQTHVSYEPVWETGYNLQIWIMGVFELMLSWCCSDKEVLKASLRLTLLKQSKIGPEFISQKNLHIAHSVKFDPVSTHAALSRFIAGLLVGFSKYSINIVEHLMQHCLPSPGLDKWCLLLMEYPLRALVLLAQVNAGMWKRNGYSILHSVMYYQNIRFTTEMFDRDIQFLQIVASLTDSNHFFDVLIQKYDLDNWLLSDQINDSQIKPTKIIAEEFVLLLFYILTERYWIGIGRVSGNEILRREVIHQLAITATSRSNLVKNLPCKDAEDDEECNFEALLDDVLKLVAVYKEPGITGKGLFELKADEHNQCNQFFIHYTKAERSKMLEKRKKVTKKESSDVQFLPNPPEFMPRLQNILRLLVCERVEGLITLVLKRAVTMELVTLELVELVLLIIAVGIFEVQRARANNSSFDFLPVLIKRPGGRKSISDLLDSLIQTTSEEFLPMASWVKELLQEELRNSELYEMDVCESSNVPSSIEEEKARKMRIARERRAMMLEQMNSMQKAFMKSHSDMFKDEEDSIVDEIDGREISRDHSFPVAIGPKRSACEVTNKQIQCILCQDENTPDGPNSFVVMVLAHKSNVCRTFDGNDNQEVLIPSVNVRTRLNVYSCGHIAHSSCWMKHFNLVRQREGMVLFASARRKTCIDMSQLEYLCPLCHSLCNSVLPLPQKNGRAKMDSSDDSEVSLMEFLAYMQRFYTGHTCRESVKKDHAPHGAVKSTVSTFNATYKWLTEFCLRNWDESVDVLSLLSKKLLQLSGSEKQSPEQAVPSIWMSFSFTLQAWESQFRATGKNMFHNIPERQTLFIHSFVRHCERTGKLMLFEPIESFAAQIFQLFSGGRHNDRAVSILDADLFSVMVSLPFIVEIIQREFREKTYHFVQMDTYLLDDVVFRLCLHSYIVKLYLTAPDFNNSQEGVNDDWKPIHGDVVIGSFSQFKRMRNVVALSEKVDAIQLKDHLMSSLLPFLRCSVYFFHCLSGVKLPLELNTEHINGNDEVKILMRYLNLPGDVNQMLSHDWLLQDQQFRLVVEKWCDQDDVKNRHFIERPCALTLKRLIPLPSEYSALICRASGFSCPVSGDISRTPCLCLICGQLLCSQCYCCQTDTEPSYGACSMHSLECADGVGLFLRVRESQIVITFNCNKGMHLPSPYLDQYGEPDPGFRRGYPLFLDERRYHNLELIWLQQRIAETVIQAMESNRTFLNYNWSSL